MDLILLTMCHIPEAKWWCETRQNPVQFNTKVKYSYHAKVTMPFRRYSKCRRCIQLRSCNHHWITHSFDLTAKFSRVLPGQVGFSKKQTTVLDFCKLNALCINKPTASYMVHRAVETRKGYSTTCQRLSRILTVIFQGPNYRQEIQTLS